MRGEKECLINGVTSYGRVWRVGAKKWGLDLECGNCCHGDKCGYCIAYGGLENWVHFTISVRLCTRNDTGETETRTDESALALTWENWGGGGGNEGKKTLTLPRPWIKPSPLDSVHLQAFIPIQLLPVFAEFHRRDVPTSRHLPPANIECGDLPECLTTDTRNQTSVLLTWIEPWPHRTVLEMEDPPAPVVLLAKVVLVVGPLIEACLPQSHAHEDTGVAFVRKPFQPVRCGKGNDHTDESQAGKSQPENCHQPLRPRQRHLESWRECLKTRQNKWHGFWTGPTASGVTGV